ncbi:ventral anterior homeobox 2 isoform X3 [Cuculus canorus]|uniref:ventral anterior homeobox 2 isoform X3 n=1 Tax=Cuculus canorus TaxID=55661 RepID=UPI0023AAE384|nr:ventral anterior homeobox 2 isoform X3 [Cuculus canorus]
MKPAPPGPPGIETAYRRLPRPLPSSSRRDRDRRSMEGQRLKFARSEVPWDVELGDERWRGRAREEPRAAGRARGHREGPGEGSDPSGAGDRSVRRQRQGHPGNIDCQPRLFQGVRPGQPEPGGNRRGGLLPPHPGARCQRDDPGDRASQGPGLGPTQADADVLHGGAALPPGAGIPALPVKVWFQNRRTKQKKDQSRDSEKRSTTTSESFATCNILRLLEQGRLLSIPAPPSLLSPTSNPITAPTGNGSSLATPGTTSPGLSGGSSPPGPGAFSLQVPSLASSSSSSSSSPRLPAAPLGFGGPLLGSLHDLPGAYGLGTSAFEPYTRLERKDNSIPSKKPSP